MISVILFGKKRDENDNFHYSICKTLKSYGNCSLLKNHIALCDKNNVSFNKEKSPTFLICDFSSEILSVKNFRDIIVIKENVLKQSKINLIDSENTIIITSEINSKNINITNNTKYSIISCGIATHNTINLSGMSKYRAFISLQREIKTLSGDIIEPHDFPVIFDFPISIYSLLTSCAILLVSGIDSSKGYFFEK